MRKLKNTCLLILFLLPFAQTSPVLAHPADIFTHNIYLNIANDTLSVKWEIKPGPLLIQAIWFNADSNQNGLVDSKEANQWVAPRVSNLTALLENETLPLQLDEVKFPANVDSFQAGQEYITIYLSSTLNNTNDKYRLSFHNSVEEQKSLNWYYINSEDDIKFEAPKQNNSKITFQVFTQPSTATQLLTAWDSSMPSLGSWQGAPSGMQLSTPEPAAPTPEQNANLEKLLNLVRAKNPSLSFYIFALVISLALGALHALTPGHGKTVVAAYLVGSRGTTWQAIVLGSVVTLTHTGSVFLLGILTLAASQYILPTTIIPLLEILSGLLIVGLGIYLLWQRIKYAPAAVLGGADAALSNGSIRKISLMPRSSKRISENIKIQKPSANLHHHGDGKMHSHDVPESITWRSLIALGISGGLVPCPDAIAILLVAVAINRILLGLALIISFSLGLAVVLIVIGLLMVNSRRLFDRFSFIDKLAPIMPVVSAIIVLILGIALTWGAYVRAKESFTFADAGLGAVNEARVIYQVEGEDQVKRLFVMNVNDGQSVALTDATNNVMDFSLSPNQTQVVYFLQTDDLQNEIWLVNVVNGENKKISDCTDAICSQPVWSPDGSRVIFEYLDLATSGLATLWWVDLQTNETQPLFQEDKLPSANPRWSADGKWLSYAISQDIRLYNFETGESHMIKSMLGTSAAWSPTSKSVLYRDVMIQNDQFVTQLFVYDLESKISTNIIPDAGYENILAAWSPDGEWIAMVRRDLSIPRGDQIWIMQSDGSDAHAITSIPNVLHGTLSWSGDGKNILYDLYDLDSFPFQAILQMVNIESNEVIDLGVTGYNPKWIWQE